MAEAALSDLAVYNAKPTLRIGGEARPIASELLNTMLLRESEGGMSSVELRFSNIASRRSGRASYAFEDETELALGTEIIVYAGDRNAPREVFRGTVTGLEAEFPEEGPPELVVLAEDALQRARMQRRTRVHSETSLGAIASDVASQLGLTPVVTGLDRVQGTWAQLNESDLAFLRRLLIRYDADLQVVGTELHVSPRSEVQRGTVTLAFRSQLRSARILADLSQQVSEVTVSGWDPLRGRRIQASSRGQNFGPGRGRRGAQLLEDGLAPRSEHLGHLAVVDQEEADALARAAFDRAARRFVCVDGTADGNPALRVGTHVTLEGLSPRFENTYYITEVCHRFDLRRGYETDFRAESASMEEV